VPSTPIRSYPTPCSSVPTAMSGGQASGYLMLLNWRRPSIAGFRS